jgi:hypothetical protein
MSHTVTIKEITELTHDVRELKVEKPEGYIFTPGQATEVAINKEEWREEKRPFTFTGLNEDDYLEFVIKIYPDHDGVTEQIGQLKAGDQLIIDEPWGAIEYKGEGVFIAGGAGITPFISIFRDLDRKNEIGNNTLIFSNKSANDIILEKEFKHLLGDQFINVITDVPSDEYEFIDGFVDKEYLESTINDFSQKFYVCGPPPFNDAMLKYLKELGADPEGLVFEE